MTIIHEWIRPICIVLLLMIGHQAIAQDSLSDLINTTNNKFIQVDKAISEGRKQDFLHLQDEIASIAEKIDDLETRFLVYNIAINKYFAYGCYQDAIGMSSTSLQKAKKIFGEKHKVIANLLYLLAFSYAHDGQIMNAINYGMQSVQMFEDIGDTNEESYIMSIILLTTYYNENHQYPESIEMLKRSLRYIDTDNIPASRLSIIYRSLANNYSSLNNYLQAQLYTEKALELYEDKQSLSYLILRQELAWLYSNNKNHEKATHIINEVCESLKTKNDIVQYALALCDKASIYIRSGEERKINEAIKFANEAIYIFETKDMILSDEYIHSLMTLTEAYRSLDLYERAQQTYKRVYDLQEKFLDKTNMDDLETLAISAVLANNLKEGLSLFQMLKKQIIQEKGEKSVDYANIVYRLSELCYLLHDYQSAITGIVEVLPIMRGDLAKSFFMLEDKDRAGFWNKYNNVFEVSLPRMCYASSKSDFSGLMFDTSLLSKGILLNTERLKRQLMEEKASVDDFVRPFFLKWQDIQAKLNDDDIAIEFVKVSSFKSASVYVAVTLRRHYEMPKLTTLFIEDELREVSDTLYYQCEEVVDLVWKPLLPELRGIKNIYFSPTGALHKIGIEYLPGMEDYNMYRLSSTRELVTKREIKTGTRAVLYGGLDYDARLDTLNRNRSQLTYEASVEHADVRGMGLRGGKEYLKHTQIEVDLIGEELKRAKWACLLDTASLGTEESFLSLSGNNINTLHIATHGFYYTKEEADDKGYQFMFLDDQKASAEDKALSRTGLIMSGANHALEGEELPDNVEDGVLTAKEIADVDLRGLDLVVLSACQTGLGDISQGEGVFGLQRGFKKAGANSILMSLWEVNDEATQILMTQFYKNLVSGQSKRLSLQSAQKYLREYNNGYYNEPKYWAAFILLDGIH